MYILPQFTEGQEFVFLESKWKIKRWKTLFFFWVNDEEAKDSPTVVQLNAGHPSPSVVSSLPAVIVLFLALFSGFPVVRLHAVMFPHTDTSLTAS